MASVDLVARLVDSAVFSGLCKVPALQLVDALSKGELRTRRPEEIANLDRAFDIDAEAEFLDWFDGHPIAWTDAGFLNDLSNADIPRDDAAEGLRLLSELASPGSFRCWEGRMMLYLDVLLEREIRDIDDLYSDQTWLEAIGAVDRSDAVGFSEDVVMRWIRTREDLGETIDATKDPRILPTMEAHQSTSDKLHRTLQTANISELHLMVGRDWTDASAWGQGQWNLGKLLKNGLPEVE
ncbi:MAG: hypothetical protein VX320_06075 [Candidatus Thermoplasmatota archaeon]|nr:hypothetical protein [Candidatus Thermoplasmatota archaeon]